jgi:endonuclease III
MAGKSKDKQKAAEIARRLIEHYGRFEVRDTDLTIHAVQGRAPFDVLIATILSQNTTDRTPAGPSPAVLQDLTRL